MFRNDVVPVAVAMFLMAPVTALAEGNQSGFEDVRWEERVVTTTTSTNQTMGNSGKAPPNERAASSKGVKTTTTTTTTIVEEQYKTIGPKGQIDQGNYDCNECTTTHEGTDFISETTETTSSGPGNRSR